MRTLNRGREDEQPSTHVKCGSYLPGPSSALIEITAYLTLLSFLFCAYEISWIDLMQAGMGVLSLLLGLVFLSWIKLDSGRHPGFMFLCLLVVFQAGRLMEFAMGSPINPYQISLLALPPFDVSSHAAAMFLCAVSLSAICIYAPCRWKYQPVSPDQTPPASRGLSYLYLVFCITLPFALLKNILLFQYADAHGGYLALFTQLDDMMASVPPIVRIMSGLMSPAFFAIFIAESRKVPLYICTILYFIPFTIVLMIGSRGSTLTAILALWCVSSIKTRLRNKERNGRLRVLQMAIVVTLLVVIASVVDNLRNGPTVSNPIALSSFIATQDSTMSVTELAIEYRKNFAQYAPRYFAEEIGSAFRSVVAQDQSKYTAGQNLAKDATVFLNPDAYDAGFGIGGSYLAEAYVAGAIPGVIIVSLLMGVGLNLLYRSCSTRLGLFVNALILPSVFWSLRGEVLDWVLALLRASFLVAVLYIGWKLYAQYSKVFSIRVS